VVLRARRFTVIASIRADSGARALESVRRQVFEDYEVLCLLDVRSREHERVIERLGGEIIDAAQPNSPSARNEALARATGQIIAFIGSDDVWHPNFLTYHARIYELYPEVLFTFTNYYSKGQRRSGPVDQALQPSEAPNALVQMVMRPFIRTISCFTAPRRFIQEIGGFAPSPDPETDLYVRLLAGSGTRKRLACLDRPVVGLPQIGLLTEVAEDEELDPATRDERRVAFLDHVFAYPFMKRYERFRSACQMTLADENRLPA
jgi:glycosyltransferase involved in cell wall biosynthesis